ncbi:2-oxoglutarate (2OG) and Fe(II)-dependent oxygenase superfamily protein [Striga asiatica]|uniref:2-oxoglutarate (2OG) and Fe(II)-dependent oxygenase superfamily protein n=1 Tax=Striga asiatica TaxID=4170 RepID=A0A5A7P9Y1_STRAF|nr:2-oxoglutarate (2OG) and Fe(II)-dependent oxygenase superfamily protein [Striga asiatica]
MSAILESNELEIGLSNLLREGPQQNVSKNKIKKRRALYLAIELGDEKIGVYRGDKHRESENKDQQAMGSNSIHFFRLSLKVSWVKRRLCSSKDDMREMALRLALYLSEMDPSKAFNFGLCLPPRVATPSRWRIFLAATVVPTFVFITTSSNTEAELDDCHQCDPAKEGPVWEHHYPTLPGHGDGHPILPADDRNCGYLFLRTNHFQNDRVGVGLSQGRMDTMEHMSKKRQSWRTCET